MQEQIEAVIENYKKQEGNIISILQEVQERFGYIPQEAVTSIAERLDIPLSNFFGVATFYSQFFMKKRGKNVITSCCGTACHVRGAERIMSAALRELNLREGEDTTEDGSITLEKVACLGTCSMAPVVVINKKMYGKITPDKLTKEIKSLKKSLG